MPGLGQSRAFALRAWFVGLGEEPSPSRRRNIVQYRASVRHTTLADSSAGTIPCICPRCGAPRKLKLADITCPSYAHEAAPAVGTGRRLPATSDEQGRASDWPRLVRQSNCPLPSRRKDHRPVFFFERQPLISSTNEQGRSSACARLHFPQPAEPQAAPGQDAVRRRIG